MAGKIKIKRAPNHLAIAIVGSVLLLICVLTIFVFVQFWYFYVEAETTEKKIAEISVSYEDRISKLVASSPVVNKDEIIKLAFLKEFKSQQVWERSHERVNRRYFSLSSSAEWFVKLIVLFLAVLNERVTSPGARDSFGLKRSTIVLVVFFAALSIALPALVHKLGFESRQRLHDFRAQQLGYLVAEVENGVTDPRSAWLRYQGLYKESPSSYANRPGF